MSLAIPGLSLAVQSQSLDVTGMVYPLPVLSDLSLMAGLYFSSLFDCQKFHTCL